MAYSTTTPGIEEATQDALVAILQAGIDDLNTAIATGGQLTLAVLTTSNVTLGDPETFPVDGTVTPVIIAVCGGGSYDMVLFETEQVVFPRTDYSAFRYRIYTNINIYIHPDAMFVSGEDANPQAGKRERLRSRLVAWVRGILNSAANADITLASREIVASPGYDHLYEGLVSNGEASDGMKNFGKQMIVYYAHLRHSGIVSG